MSVIRVAVDAMGGDRAPEEVVKGAALAIGKCPDLEVLLTGNPKLIQPLLKKYSIESEKRVTLVPAFEVIEVTEHPVNALKKKKDSSLRVAFNLLKEGKADAVVSAGSSGAVLAGGMLLVGRSRGVERPPFAAIIPTEKGVSMLLDSGANLNSKPSQLLQYAIMGTIYMKEIIGIDKPTVGIVNIGAEDEKGDKLVQESIPLLRSSKDINFIGSIESREIPAGGADVIVCDAFVGNVILKLYEGVASSMMRIIKKGLMSTTRSKIGALLSKPALKNTLKTFDSAEYGGAPMLGLKGLVVKAHGNSKSAELCNSILQCVSYQEKDINGIITAKLSGKLNGGKEAAKES